MPFIQMMIAMMNFMDTFMNGNKYYHPGMNYWGTMPYSSFPGSSFTNFANYPMSPLMNGQFPLNKTNFWPNGSKPESSLINDKDNNHQEDGSDNKLAQTNDNNLNGIWQALSGDVIAIYNNNRFIWSDGNSRNLAGRLIIRGKMFFAYIPAKKITLQFEYYREPGQFVVRDKNGQIYTFKRIY